MRDCDPFQDLRRDASGAVVIPLRKWREILFVGAMRPVDGGAAFMRDPQRRLPSLRRPGALPLGRRFRAETIARVRQAVADPLNPPQRDRTRIRLVPLD